MHPPPGLAAAVFAVPRHHFVPAQAWASTGAAGYWIDRHADPDTWWRAVCTDTVIVTQLDEGRTPLTPSTAADHRHARTCSASAPHLVTAALHHLAPARGDRVLDIGTGTGWTAALLAHLVGAPEPVTTVEVDPGPLSAPARWNRSGHGTCGTRWTTQCSGGRSTAAPGVDRGAVSGGGIGGRPSRCPFGRRPARWTAAHRR